MAFLEDPRKRAAEERKVRIDHSDVYFQNEKLTEVLTSKLDRLASQRHRQISNHDHEIKLLRKTLSAMNSPNSSSSAADSHHPLPTTTTTTTPTPNITTNTTTNTTTAAAAAPTSSRRQKAPRALVKLDVHVPHHNHHSQDSDDVDTDDDDDDDDSSDEDARPKPWETSATKRTRVAWVESNPKDKEDSGTRTSSGPAKYVVKKATREQLILHNLDLNAIPSSWFTQVHQPSDVVPRRRRASSVHASNRPTLPTTSSTSSAIPTASISRRPQSEVSRRPLKNEVSRRPQSETSVRPSTLRRTKSALPGSVFSLGPSGTHEEEIEENELRNGASSSSLGWRPPPQPKKVEGLRSRRQLMEEMGVGPRAAVDPGGGGEASSDAHRLRYLTALRRERERLEGRVKLFLQSCDGVGEGGVRAGDSSRKSGGELHSFLLPQALT